MRILTFTTALRLEPEVVGALERLTNQRGDYIDTLVSRDNPYPALDRGEYKNMCLNYEKARRIAVNEGYSKVWFIESDTIPPPDALEKLLSVDAQVVSGLYVLRHGVNQPNVFMPDERPSLLGCYPWDFVKSHWGEVVPMSGGCTGCVLVDVETLKDYCFKEDGSVPDMRWMLYCIEKGYKQMAHLGVVCGHKDPSGNILWPDKETGWRVERT